MRPDNFSRAMWVSEVPLLHKLTRWYQILIAYRLSLIAYRLSLSPRKASSPELLLFVFSRYRRINILTYSSASMSLFTRPCGGDE